MVNNNTRKITALIKEKAGEVGFDLVGITTAEPFYAARKILPERNLSEFIANDIELLTTPDLHLAGVRSIIALALSYASSAVQVQHQEECYISLYARGKDYHKVMAQKMAQLSEFIQEIRPGAKVKAYSDTGALLDRAISCRAGLGWIGKNNNLINPTYGSYLFLGEILTDLELTADQEITDRCGECELCLKSCPAGALIEQYHLEAKHCISYLTQKKGILPEEERKLIGRNLWGCDRCQQVCPFNQGVPVDRHPQFKARLTGDIQKILSFLKGGIEPAWRDSALFWQGLRILKRNSIINIVNSGNTDYIPLISREINNPSPLIRAYVVWALGELDYERNRTKLKALYQKEREGIVRAELAKIFAGKNKERSDDND